MDRSSSMIRIYLVDDQSILRAAFRTLLGQIPAFEVVGDSGDARKAVEEIGELEPHVVLLDITMPGLSGIDAIPMIRKRTPKVKIVMLTHHEGESFVDQSLEGEILVRVGAERHLAHARQVVSE